MWIKASESRKYWGEVANMREKQREKSWTQGEAKSRLDGGKHPSKCKWLNLSILANLFLL